MESTTQVAILEQHEQHEQQLTALDIKGRVNLIQQVMHGVMIKGTHYGIIPGTDKPALFKAGAEVLNVTFRLAPRYAVQREDLGNGHREYTVTTTLYHIPTGQVVGEGVGSCSTLESKYRYRYASRLCPQCQKDAIARSKPEFGGGWYCNQRKGGCGAKFAEDATAIIGQDAGRVENLDIADQYNTVLKMAKKRSHVDGTLTATAASDIFVQTTADEEEEEKPLRSAPMPTTRQSTPQSPPTTPAPALLITKPQQARLFAICKTAGVTPDDFRMYLELNYELAHTSGITRAQYEKICQDLENGTVSSWLLAQSDEGDPAAAHTGDAA